MSDFPVTGSGGGPDLPASPKRGFGFNEDFNSDDDNFVFAGGAGGVLAPAGMTKKKPRGAAEHWIYHGSYTSEQGKLDLMSQLASELPLKFDRPEPRGRRGKVEAQREWLRQVRYCGLFVICYIFNYFPSLAFNY